MNVANRGRGFARVACRGVLLSRIGDVDQMMRNPASIGDAQLVGADIEPPIHGRRIAIDDFAPESLAERQRERALPGGGRSQDGHNQRSAHQISERERART